MVADRKIKGSSSGFKCWNTLRCIVATMQLEICRFLIEEDSFDVNSLSVEGEPLSDYHCF
jgi:hypothetical protein